MEAAFLPYGGGWLSSRPTGSTGPLVKKSLSAFITCALLVGTGGHMTINYVVDRHDRGYRFNQFDSLSSLFTAGARTPAEDLAYVREVLKPSVSELANLFGVSRQTVYDWHSGTQPAPVHIARLEDLARAADIFTTEGVIASSQMLRRVIANDKNFLEMIREGESAENTARMLILVLRRERDQRRAVEGRLGDRRKPSVLSAEHGGVPMLDESI